MCGGAIIADFIPRKRGRGVTASDLWPDSPFAKTNVFNSEFCQLGRNDFERPRPFQDNNHGFGYDLNQFGGYATDPIVISGEENSASGSEAAYSYCNNPDMMRNVGFAAPVKVEEEEEELLAENRVVGQVGEENQVEKLSEELMAYENYMKFYQIPYVDGQSTTEENASVPQENVIDELW
ncbi:ethylene-responsive-like protein [Corchorus olitorius]|uniref:Ethylene-responsive-like protein n=1 Tax=Corchorus olitorius TaxID=93759 RepID=A0A1R3IHF2_9ROSI|nr:ethylene-responsive-like protein [Corchorus olitorius]